MMELTPSLFVQLVSCTAACVGFAYWFNVKGIQVLYAGIGAFFTWLVYALLYEAGYSNFLATLVGSIFVPLVPGPNLYYMMYCIVMEEHEQAVTETITLLVTCLGIALGFIVVEILSKHIGHIVKKKRS